jgi:hypothetical protein
VRPVLWLHRGDARRRMVAVLDHKPWAADDGDPWMAAFAWDGGALHADKAELDVGRELVVELPLPGRKAPASTPARPRQPSELERVRDELTAAARERRALQAALDTATSHAGEVEQLQAERDRALEAAEQARADGERLVNDEYRQRQNAVEAAERAAERARETEAALDLARRQLAAARKSYAAVEAERDQARRLVKMAMAERDEARAAAPPEDALEAALAERDAARHEVAELRERLAEATVEHDVLAEPAEEPPASEPPVRSEELAAGRAEQQRLEAELAGAGRIGSSSWASSPRPATAASGWRPSSCPHARTASGSSASWRAAPSPSIAPSRPCGSRRSRSRRAAALRRLQAAACGSCASSRWRW